MANMTEQMKTWSGQFGRQYTDRNVFSPEELDNLYLKNYGVTKTALNDRFLRSEIDRSARILEVGSNIGNQLLSLQKMGFTNLSGLELQSYAVELSKQRTSHINIIQGSALDIPYKDGSFDMVFTHGLLIHIKPADIKKVLQEIHRCAKKYIWGFEAWASEYKEVIYRGRNNLFWKTDFVKLYLEAFADLILIKEERIKYLDNDNFETMFLLKKK